MPRNHGLRKGTRHKFSQPHRKHGHPNLTTHLINFRLGDIVDIKANASVHRGMPHSIYHGKTGRVWNVAPRGIGVEVLKRVRGRYIRKRICVRKEHVHLSRCEEELKARKKQIREAVVERAKKNKDLKAQGKPLLRMLLFLFIHYIHYIHTLSTLALFSSILFFLLASIHFFASLLSKVAYYFRYNYSPPSYFPSFLCL